MCRNETNNLVNTYLLDFHYNKHKKIIVQILYNYALRSETVKGNPISNARVIRKAKLIFNNIRSISQNSKYISTYVDTITTYKYICHKLLAFVDKH